MALQSYPLVNPIVIQEHQSIRVSRKARQTPADIFRINHEIQQSRLSLAYGVLQSRADLGRPVYLPGTYTEGAGESGKINVPKLMPKIVSCPG